MIRLDVSMANNNRQLMVTFEEKAPDGSSPLKQKFPKEVRPDQLRTLAQSVHGILYTTVGSERGKNERLKEIGQQLFHLLFSPEVKQKFAKACSSDLNLFIDDELVWIPWEILHDGEDFFCLRFNMGREVRVSHAVFDNALKNSDFKVNIVIIADPRGDLPKAYQEGIALHDELSKGNDGFLVNLTTTSLDKLSVFNHLIAHNIVHYAGHAVYNPAQPDLSGWCMSDGELTARDIMQMAGGKTSFPALIFCNACQSGHSSKWPGIDAGAWIHHQAFDLVNAFLRSGARHYIGASQKIADSTSRELALAFYSFLRQSYSIGESLRRARLKLFHEFGPDNLIWATYLLYGDPAVCYLKRLAKENRMQPGSQGVKTTSPDELPRSPDGGKGVGEGRAPSARVSVGGQKKGRIRIGGDKKFIRDLRTCGIKGFLLFVFIAALIYFVFQLKSTMPPPPQLSKEEWEAGRWKIVWQLQEDMAQKFSEAISTSELLPSSALPDKEAPLEMCIMPAISPDIRGVDDQMTARLIEELKLVWSHQSGYRFLERERLDFVLGELKRLTLTINEEQLQFALRQVLGARRILFVRVFSPPVNFFIRFLQAFFPGFGREREVFVRFVDTQSSVWKASAKMSFKDNTSLEKISRQLAILILRDLEERSLE